MSPHTILILGGLAEDYTRSLLTYLLTTTTSPSPTLIRIVDKHFVVPAEDAYTVYMDSRSRELLKQGVKEGRVEYVQGNLLVEGTRRAAFELPVAHGGPEGAFQIVFDCTGETDHSLPSVVHIERTLRLALLLGHSAEEARVGVYVRMMLPFYHFPGKKGVRVGGEELDGPEPWGVRAKWYHEAARGLGLMSGLNLVLVRPALLYGPYTITGVTPRVLIGEVYKHLGEKLEFLWSETLAQNTIHTTDFASAAHRIALYTLSLPRHGMHARSIEALAFPLTSSDDVSRIPGAASMGDRIQVPVFNIVDDGETKQEDLRKVIAEVVGVKSGFHGSLISGFAKMNMRDVLEDVNEKHLEGWSSLLGSCNPPLSNTVPISPYIPEDLLQRYPINISNAKIKAITGWSPKYQLTSEVVRDTVSKFKEEGNWPVVEGKKGKK